MKKPVLFIFLTYVWTKTLFGLTVTPYKSVREMTRNKVLVPIVLSPVYGLVALFIIGRILAYILHPGGFYRTLISLTLSTALISILLWQLLLVYLLLSFYFGLKQK